MPIPAHIIANADDLGLNTAVNNAVLFCFEQGYVNSASLLTNTNFFEETVSLLYRHPYVHTIGIHINVVEGKPVSRFKYKDFLDAAGNWNKDKVNNKYTVFNAGVRTAFYEEITAQIEKAIASGIAVTHLDSHYHIHTLPSFYPLFIKAAQQYQLKLRIAQTYYEGNSLKFLYRQFINYRIKQRRIQFSDYFENINSFLKQKSASPYKTTEIMLHPILDAQGLLSDHYDYEATASWIAYLDGGK